MADITIPIPKERDLYFAEQVDQKSINELMKNIVSINENDEYLKKLYKIHDLDYKSKPIKIYIDSYGGACYQCFGLISVMDSSETPIHTIATGAAMSCGFMLLISGHKRFCHKLATPLYHQVSTGFWGKLKDMEDDFMEAKRLQQIIEEITLKRTKITKKKLKEIYNSKTDWFMSAEDALELGVVDKII